MIITTIKPINNNNIIIIIIIIISLIEVNCFQAVFCTLKFVNSNNNNIIILLYSYNMDLCSSLCAPDQWLVYI